MLDQLLPILKRNASSEANTWLEDFLARQDAEFNQRQLYFAFSGATRRFAKEELENVGDDVVNELRIDQWTVDQLARTIMLLSLAKRPENEFIESFEALLRTADMRESIAIYSALSLFPCPDRLVPWAREGLRSNITGVFDAIALHNPFPAAHFDEEGWNQMVLKALFIARPLWKITGLDQRANSRLAEALSNLAHERWAAGRPVSPELWRSCQNHVDETIAKDVERVAKNDEFGQREAAALVYAHTKGENLGAIKPLVTDLLEGVEAGKLSWDELGSELEKRQSI